jgi:hypothetical protein
MKRWIVSTTLVVGLCMAGSVYAGDGDGCQKAGGEVKSCCAKDKGAAVAAAKEGCGKGAGMPVMSFKVGDKATCCPDEAAKLAKTDGKAIKYIVLDKEYAEQPEAMKALSTALSDHFQRITTVQFVVGDQCMQCPMSAMSVAQKNGKKVQYRVASFTFDEKEKADKAVAAAREAAAKISMKVLQDGKEVACNQAKSCDPTKSCPAAGGSKSEAKPVEYVIGETKTCCPLTADVELQRAKILAALAALEQPVASTNG